MIKEMAVADYFQWWENQMHQLGFALVSSICRLQDMFGPADGVTSQLFPQKVSAETIFPDIDTSINWNIPKWFVRLPSGFPPYHPHQPESYWLTVVGACCADQISWGFLSSRHCHRHVVICQVFVSFRKTFFLFSFSLSLSLSIPVSPNCGFRLTMSFLCWQEIWPLASRCRLSVGCCFCCGRLAIYIFF